MTIELTSFFLAFVSLVVTTFLYAAVVGEYPEGCRATSLSFVSSLGFSLAILPLVFGVVSLMRTWGMTAAAWASSRIVALAAAPIIYGYMVVTAVDVRRVAEATTTEGTGIDAVLEAFWLILVSASLALLVTTWFWRRAALVLSSLGALLSRGLAVMAGAVTLGIASTALATAEMARGTPSYTISSSILVAAMLALFVVLGLFVIMMLAFLPDQAG